MLFFINNSAVGLAGWDDCDDEEAVQFSFCVLQSSIVTWESVITHIDYVPYFYKQNH